MYKDNRQLRIEDYVFLYGELDRENDWVKLAARVPWEVVEDRYAAQFVNNGHPTHPCRMALGALLIQRQLKCSDAWLVKHIGENPYLQFFIGMKEYGPCPFGALTLVAFRKRFSEEDMAAILEASIPQTDEEHSDDDNDRPNGGTLMVVGRSASWRIKSTATGRRWHSARNMASVCPARLLANRPRSGNYRVWPKNRNIKTVATAMR